MEDPANPVRINEKWISIIIWVALLYVLFLTTSNGAIAGFGGNVRNFYATFFASGLFPDTNVAINQVATATAVVTLLLAIALVFALFDAWSRFIHLTNQLLIAFVESSLPGDRNPILFELLNFKISREAEKPTHADESDQEPADEEPAGEVIVETKPDEAIGSLIGSVLKGIAISWAIIILTPGVIILISMIAH